MAMTHDYLDLLDEKIAISPANSEEELQAAEVIAELMGRHDVEASVEEFSAPVVSGLVSPLLAAASLVGMVLVGVGVLPLTLIGFVLAVAPAAISVLRLFGRAPHLALGPQAQSQNVVAVHRATGPLVTKGSRTIVIAAHYDTPHENFLYSSPVTPYLTLIGRLTVPCSFVVAGCAFIQILGFLPAPFRIVLWIVGILAAAPATLLAVGSIAERTAPCTDGANDNKASVAALLGVLENVRPSGDRPKSRPASDVAAEPAETDEQEPVADEVPAPVTEPVFDEGPVIGVRHGEEVLRSLAILPESCEIEYVAPAPAERPAPAPAAVSGTESVSVAAPIAAAPVSKPEADEAYGPAPASNPLQALFERVVALVKSKISPAPAPEAEAEDLEETPVDSEPAPEATDSEAVADEDALAEVTASTAAETLATASFQIVMDDGSEGVGPKDTSGLSTMDEEYDPDATQPAEPLERPDAPSDPEWGKTSYRPQLSNVARRASLFDLPGPSASETDPFATDPNGTRVRTADDAAAPVESQFEVLTGTPQVEPLGTTDADDDHGAEKPKRSLLGRLRGKGQSDGEDSDDGRTWRGGAATRGDLRLVEDGEQPSEGDLRDAVLSLGDDALVAHDIWFVALGGSALDHAGMQAFLARHRSEIRGCFIVNLDCVGAGRLVALKNEGREETRRADRRMMRLLGGVAGDLHVQLGQETHDWADTDATPAMRSSLRAVTLMGVDESGLPALSRTPEDTIENVSGDQASQVAAIVTEMIRRS